MVAVQYVKVFSDDPTKGNLAGVVTEASKLSDGEMQQVAAAVGASESSFVLSSRCADLKVRWFTPNTEVGICVHATIAAVGAARPDLLQRGAPLQVETKNAILAVEKVGELIFVNFPGYAMESRMPDRETVLHALALGVTDVVGSPRIVNVFQDHELVVQVRSFEDLRHLRPEIESYAALCKSLGVTGISIFTEDSQDHANHVHLREFAPLYGYLEDPLCGMAAGCVMTYLRAHGSSRAELLIEQGFFCNTGGVIAVQHRPDSGIWVGGNFCVADRKEIEIK